MGSATSRAEERTIPQLPLQDSAEQQGQTSEMSKKEMETVIVKLRNDLEGRDRQIHQLTEKVAAFSKEYEVLKKKMVTLQKHGGTENSAGPDISGENRSLKVRLMALEQEMREREKEIESLRDKLLQMRMDKDKQVQMVRKTVDKVIQDKDFEIRRLRALWESQELAGSENVTSPLSNTTGRAGISNKARFGISAGNLSDDITVESSTKTESERWNITRAFKRNIFLTNLAHSQVEDLINHMAKNEIEKGSIVMKEGEAGTFLYIIETGEVEVYQTISNKDKCLAVLGPGCVFGELAILYNCKRTASVRTKTNAVLWSMDRRIFQNVVQRRGRMIREEYLKLLKSVGQLEHVPEEKLMRVADCLEEESFASGEYIIRQGETGDTFYIIYEGMVKVTKSEGDSNTPENDALLCYLEKGHFFGEKALLGEEKRAANVVACSDVTCLTLDRIAFHSLIGPITEGNLSAENQEDIVSTLSKQTSKLEATSLDDAEETDSRSAAFSLTMKERRVISETKLENLKIIQTIGKGGFGSVKLVRISSVPNHSFALKMIKKAFIVKSRQQNHIIAERTIMISVRSIFIGRLYRTFKDDSNIYMLMDAYLGGDLYTKLKKGGRLDNEAARFCIACITEALAYLHARNIAYRDLKPENVMLDRRGYLKLIDFGFAKRIKSGNKTWTFCGTPEYFAPEILQNLGHDFSVDYWALGILTFEVSTGTTPFYAQDDLTVYERIIEGIERIKFPATVSKNTELLIRHLCRRDPKSRLGNRSGGINDIRKHRWFRGFHWEGLRLQSLVSPIKVDVSGPFDLCNFEAPPEKNATSISEQKEEHIDTSSWDHDF